MSALLSLLDAIDDLSQARELRERTYLGLGDTVVDVGCGGGRAVRELGERGVRVVGVDRDPVMLSAAVGRWPGGEFRVADAAALPFGDGVFTGYRADKVLHTLVEPGVAVAEARRVLATGGRAVLVGQDWDTIVVESDQPELTRALVHARADAMASPRVARRYRNLLLDNGFVDVTVEVHTLLFTGSMALPMLSTVGDGGWLDEQVTRARDDRLFVAVPMFLAAGTRGG